MWSRPSSGQYFPIEGAVGAHCKLSDTVLFSRPYLIKKVIPNYAKIKIAHTSSPVTKITQKNVQTIRLKDEIKFLYIRKGKLNNRLYRINLKAAQEWGNVWYTILDSIHALHTKIRNFYTPVHTYVCARGSTY